jgi:CTP synthase
VPLDKKRKEKIAISCNIFEDRVISAPDIESVYDVPINFEKDKMGDIILKTLKLKTKTATDSMTKWKGFVNKINNTKDEVNIAIVGKYFDTGDFVLSDAYVSVIEAIKFSAYSQGVKPRLSRLSSKDFETDPKKVKELSNYDGIIVPGGFGETGIEGKINVIRYARENKIPYFGLCYGMQLAVIEFARNVLGLKDANTAEINPKSKNLVIDIMPEQKKNLAEGNYGATMRLGAYPAILKEGTIAEKAYGKKEISERHRHRYEVNPEYVEKISQGGMVFSGTSPDGVLMEIAELPRDIHPFFLGTQFHPEFQARPIYPHPLFTEFIKASIQNKLSMISMGIKAGKLVEVAK